LKSFQFSVAGICLALLLSSSGTNAQTVEPGVSKSLAVSRAERISDLHYALSFQLLPHVETISGRETIHFKDSGNGDLSLDFREGTISQASLNSKVLDPTLKNGHLNLPASALLKGDNELKLTFTSLSAAAGKAFTRYEDRDDRNEYVYSLFVPMDASMAFPCFDQPDLKGRFALQVDAPAEWTVVANTAANSITKHGATARSVFPETRPISTYLFAFAAGPFERIVGANPTEPTIYVRKSQLARAKTEAPQVQKIAASGIHYFSGYFAQPFPFPKYDLVLIPGFPFGGMEHAGATFLNEDGVLFRTAPTASDYFRRNILVLHETCHQWFGDLVTMRWFDDLWLKEGFAQYMAYKALAELEPAQIPWKHFYEEIKPAAYGIDETQGTTPIFQNIANLKDAKSAYGAIVYQKAPAVLKQLNFFLGEDSFRDGLRLYLKEHAYANAQWADLVRAFETASGQHHASRDVQSWARAWILQRGMPEITTHYKCSGGKIASLTLHQHDVLPENLLWPMSNEVLLASGGAEVQIINVRWDKPEFSVSSAIGKPCPDLVFANEGDFGYGRFLLDAPSTTTVSASLTTVHSTLPESVDESLRRSMLWGALWDNVHVAQTSPSSYVELTLKSLSSETDEALSRIQGGHVSTALHTYMSETERAKYVPRVEAILSERMVHAPAAGLRIVSYRTFTGVAETPHALGQIKSLLNGNLTIEGMPLRPLDRWNLIGHLIAMKDPDATALFSKEKSSDQTGEGQKYAYAVEAGSPSAETKARYFEEYLHTTDRQEDWITQSLQPFNSWNQTDLTAPYIVRALDALPEIKQHRKIFFLGSWLSAFVDGQHSLEAQAAVHHWLSLQQSDPDLRLKVLEVSGALDRTVMIRQKFAH
jgi:aminopeptidase N